MKKGLWEWFEGVLLLEVHGNVSLFLAKVAKANVELWDTVQISEGIIRLKMGMRDFLSLPHPFPGCDIVIIQRSGMPVISRLLRARKLFVTGAMFFMLTLSVLSLFVWRIEIRGANRVHPGQVMRALSEEGIQVGTPLWSVQRDTVRESLQQRFTTEVNWVSLTIRGSKVTVELVERPEPFEAKTGDIFALESGIITQIHVQQGEALYQTGAMVRQGDPLVLGFQRDSLGRYQPIRAEAQIQARIWREIEVTVPYQRVWYEPTGQSMRITWFRWGEQSWPIGGTDIPYAHYRADRNLHSSFFDLHWLNAEVFDIIYVELSELCEEFTPDEAERRAEESALLQIAQRMPATSRLQSEQREVNHSEDGVTVRLIWESVEEIGLLVPHR